MKLKLTPRDKRALILLGVVGFFVIVYVLSTSGPGVPAVVSPSRAMTISAAELELARLRESVRRGPGKEEGAERGRYREPGAGAGAADRAQNRRRAVAARGDQKRRVGHDPSLRRRV